MSCRPQRFGGKEPTGAVRSPSQRLPHSRQLARPRRNSSPQGQFVSVPAPRRVFPLGLARQTVAGTGLRGEPRRVGAGVRSGDVDHWPAPAAPAVVVRLVVSPAALRLQVAVVVVECHLVLGHGERRRDVHLAGRSLAPPTNGVCAAVAAHPEPPGRYDHHLGAAVAGAQNIPEGLLRGVPRGEAVRRQSRAEQGSHRQHGRPRNGRPR